VTIAAAAAMVQARTPMRRLVPAGMRQDRVSRPPLLSLAERTAHSRLCAASAGVLCLRGSMPPASAGLRSGRFSKRLHGR